MDYGIYHYVLILLIDSVPEQRDLETIYGHFAISLGMMKMNHWNQSCPTDKATTGAMVKLVG